MSASDCPFKIIRSVDVDDDDKKSDHFVKFKLPMDSNNANGLKSSIHFLKLDSDEPEDVLTHSTTSTNL